MQLKQLGSLAFASLVAAQSLTDALGGQSDLSQLASLLGQYPDLVSTLSKLSNITVLAPSNNALATFLNDTTVTAMAAADPGIVPAVLSYHVLNGTFRAANITATPAFPRTLLTNASYTNVTGGQAVEARAAEGDGGGGGGNVTFYSWLRRASNVTTADVAFDGGVLHVVDRVLSLPMNDSATAVAANLTALAGALTDADLVGTVDGLRDVTVFAPTNDAFGAIANLVGNLSTEQLGSVLQYHVVQGTVGYSSGLSNATLPTVAGQQVTISVVDGEVFVNSAKVVAADYLVSNGVVHVIDNVLNPMNSTASPDASASTQAPAFSGASSASDIPFTSGVPTPTVTEPGANPTGGGSMSTSGSKAAAVPVQTAAVGAAALFGGAAVLANL